MNCLDFTREKEHLHRICVHVYGGTIGIEDAPFSYLHSLLFLTFATKFSLFFSFLCYFPLGLHVLLVTNLSKPILQWNLNYHPSLVFWMVMTAAPIIGPKSRRSSKG